MARDDNGARSAPSNHTSPAVGSISFSTERPIVLLPEPDSPTRPSTSPLAISKLTSSTARTGRSPWPKYFLRPRTASIAAVTADSRLAYAPVVPAKAPDRHPRARACKFRHSRESANPCCDGQGQNGSPLSRGRRLGEHHHPCCDPAPAIAGSGNDDKKYPASFRLSTSESARSKHAPAYAARALTRGNVREGRHRGGTLGQYQRAARGERAAG